MSAMVNKHSPLAAMPPWCSPFLRAPEALHTACACAAAAAAAAAAGGGTSDHDSQELLLQHLLAASIRVTW
jgi:hypothetical protein